MLSPKARKAKCADAYIFMINLMSTDNVLEDKALEDKAGKAHGICGSLLQNNCLLLFIILLCLHVFVWQHFSIVH